MTGFAQLLKKQTIGNLILRYPIAGDFLANYNLGSLPRNKPFETALEDMEEERLAEFGFTRTDMVSQFLVFLEAMLGQKEKPEDVRSLTILGGQNKLGEPENVSLTVCAGEIISIVGPTGSGKSCLLGDIECVAQRDTPTRRQILVNGKVLSDEERFRMDGKLVAQLSQNMNFIMDLSVEEFLELHAKSRLCENTAQVIEQCFLCANELAGEKFTLRTKVTQLSGGQSRALMIADTAYMSTSPVVLIDEIENAGIDRKRAVRLLARNEKIVLISTHDPILALNADKRIVIKNGGIYKVMETSPEERASLSTIDTLDNILLDIRGRLRRGERIVFSEADGKWREKVKCGSYTMN
jgi:ABC-type lipoprotein export system ATPase subunit